MPSRAPTGATPAQVRLAWTLQQGRHVLAIPGTAIRTTSQITRPPQRYGCLRTK